VPPESAEQEARTRYRFRKQRPPEAPPQAPVRPERISGRIIQSQVPPQVETADIEEEEEKPETPAAFEPPIPAPAHPPRQVSAGIDDLLESLGRPQPVQELEPLPFEPAAPEAYVRGEEPITEAAEALEHEEAAATEAETSSGRRRRRRRGRGHSGTAEGGLAERAAHPEHPEHPEAAHAAITEPQRGATLYPPYPPVSPVPNPYAGVVGPSEAENGYVPEYEPGEDYEAPYLPGERGQGWDIASSQQQMRERRGPFVSPEPSFARGFGPQPSGVAGPARETYPRTTRTGRGDRDVDVPPMSANQLGAVITGAIQRQTDRLLTELRHQQHPPSMTVMMPAYPSTERVGVFVDVANLVYSARNLRMTIDFGNLLEFLRGNRRLIRAHAYAPTDPDPKADQAFLHAVKGLGYRITTKNYKTFASGAKKADMDLDLCMDIVRMVDAGALDTVVLVSGDSDFLPLLEYCSDHGVRVEVAAFDDSAAAILRQSCDLFVNLSLVDEIRV
jgi:uncharacterized LabA/DUF88 family protein